MKTIAPENCRTHRVWLFYTELLLIALRAARPAEYDEEVPKTDRYRCEEHSNDYVNPQILGYTCLPIVVEPIEKGHRENSLQLLVVASIHVAELERPYSEERSREKDHGH